MRHKPLGILSKLPLLVVGVAGLGLLWQHQAVKDWWALRGYDPPASISGLADDTELTPAARRLFYVNHPEIEDRAAFNASCSNRGEHTIVLGCYHPVDRGIFIFHVADDRLNGVDQVTAAHEMLHAAYDRLGGAERSRVDGWLQDFYAHGLYDDRIKTIIASYQQTEPHDVVNEMHSIFGTEVAVLPPDLENYYSQYFADRTKIVDYANAYQDEFTSRQTQVARYDSQLKNLKQQIDADSASLNQQEAEIKLLRAQMDSERAAGDIAGYNADVPGFNDRIDSYNGLITTTKDLISSYNQIVGERNQIALQVADLAHSIDSSFQPINQ